MTLSDKKPNLPINNLMEFMTETETLLNLIIKDWGQLLFPREFRYPMHDAWDEIKGKNRTDIISIRTAVTNANKEALRKAGLYKEEDPYIKPKVKDSEKQLEVKLKGLNDAWEKFDKHGTVNLLMQLLDWINGILGSLASVVPGTESLKELKDTIEKIITHNKYK